MRSEHGKGGELQAGLEGHPHVCIIQTEVGQLWKVNVKKKKTSKKASQRAF